MTNKKGGSKLPILIALAVLVLAAGIFALVYFFNRPQATQGTKAYTVTLSS